MCPVMVLPDPLASFSLDLEFLMSGTFSSLIIIFSTILVNVLCPKIHLLRSWTFNSSPLAFFLFLLYSLSLFFLFLLYSLEIFLTLSSRPFTECFGPSIIIFYGKEHLFTILGSLSFIDLSIFCFIDKMSSHFSDKILL